MAGQTEQIINSVLAGIDGGEYLPGDQLDEARLMAQHGVSRTPVREALIKLEASGLIRRFPRKGAELFRPSLEEFVAILEVHANLEGQAAGLAARRLSLSDGKALEQVVLACEQHAAQKGDADPAGYYRLNLQFHEAVALASGNPVLVETLKTNARKLLAYYRARYRYPGVIADSAREHREIATLIFDHRSDEAVALMTRHVQFDQVTIMDLLAALG